MISRALAARAVFFLFAVFLAAPVLSQDEKKVPEGEIIADDFPLPSVEHLLPGYRITTPPKKENQEKKQEKSFEVSTRVTSPQEASKGVWERLQPLFADRTWVNVLILIGLAAIFVIYRVR
ncbi:MAG: hypothetical protein HY042_06000, partial [Spirochaetia bacterium]|nr:hypothetical protein [Spirochaetia bacterium]